MDESGSVSAGDWQQEQNFVKELPNHFKFGSSGAQFGVISFSTDADLDIQLNSHSNAASFKQAVDRIKQARKYCVTAWLPEWRKSVCIVNAQEEYTM